jgi:hypothetical protein
MIPQVIWTDNPIVFKATLIRCAVCRDLLHPEDFRPDMFREEHVAAMHEKHGVNVCFTCMDEAGRDATPVGDEWL